MDILERKGKLMQRDPLCIEFDDVLCASLRDYKNERLGDKRKKLEQEIKDKWCVKVYVPEVQVKIGRMFEENPKDSRLSNLKREDFLGSFKWWTIAGEHHRAVIDAREKYIVILEDGIMLI